jgi:CIC family chloride channel protein
MTGGYIGWSLIFLAFAKILAMSLTISSGGSGGVFGPNVYIGGMVGAWVAFATDQLIPNAALIPLRSPSSEWPQSLPAPPGCRSQH